MSSVSASPRSGSRWLELLTPVLLVAVVAWLLFARGMQRDLNHDEHQFLAPGALLAREGLLPYRDYPLFHLPNLVFAYGAMDRLMGCSIASAKLLSIVASTGLIALLTWLIWRERELSVSSRVLLAGSVAILLLYDPVFLFTAGKTWNHEVPTALIVAAIVVQGVMFSRPSLLWAGVAGVLGGLSAGSRLTFGPMLIPLFIVAWLVPGSRALRVRHGLAWSLGAFLGLLPSLWLLCLSPEGFLFGNFEFPRLRVSDATNFRVQKTIRLSAKFRYFLKEVMRPSWPLFLLFLGIGVRPAWTWLRTRQGSAISGLVLLVFPFALFGCFAPTRYQYQHFFGVIGLVALGVTAALPSALRRYGRRNVLRGAVIATVAGVCAGYFTDRVKDRYTLINEPMNSWFAWDLHKQVAEFRSYVPSGRILTLAPVLPLEAGLAVYPQFAAGPFGWKSAHLVRPDRRSSLHLVAPADLEQMLASNPPAGILTGVEDEELEKPIIAYAKAHGYQPVQLQRRRVIWIPATKT
ncbi:hypothetical protein ACXR0O_11050 [Verrucomicrobiota bacterium sgz303538]